MPTRAPAVDVRLETLAAAERHWRQGDFSRATAYAQMSFNWFPDDPATWKCLVMILVAQGRWANARLSLRQALAMNPTDAALSLWAQALEVVESESLSNHDLWLPSLADAMLAEAHPQDADALAWVATRLGVTSPWVAVCRAKALALMKRRAEAKGVLREALSTESQSPHHWVALAQLGLDAHETSEAIAVLREGLTRFPDDLQLILTLTPALLSVGDLDGAEALVFPENASHLVEQPELLIQRGTVRMRQREFSEAQTYFRRALEMWLEVGAPARVRTAVSKGFDSEWIELAMWETLRYLHDHDIQAFPTSGTLLGLIRDGGLLPFDKDWDFGVPWEQMPAAVDCLLRHGWQELNSSYGLVNPRAFRHSRTGLVLDLCGMLPEPNGEHILGGFWMDAPPGTDDRVTLFPKLDLQRVARGSGCVWMPRNADQWLTALYGNWHKPDPHFDTVVGAQNLRGFSALTRCYALMRIATRWQQGQVTKVLSLLSHTRKHLPDDELLIRLERHLRTSSP